VEQRTAEVLSGGGTPAVVDGGTEGAGIHCSHLELKTMDMRDYVHTLLPAKLYANEVEICS
jgi:hypothetical protein